MAALLTPSADLLPSADLTAGDAEPTDQVSIRLKAKVTESGIHPFARTQAVAPLRVAVGVAPYSAVVQET